MDSDGTRFAAILETTSFLHDFKALHDSIRPWSVSCVLIVVSLNFKAFLDILAQGPLIAL
jgi:hypothetical protein